MRDMMKAQIDEYRRQGVAVVVLEAAILIEANWTPLVDEVWVTIAPDSAVLERLKKQRGLAEEQTLSRIRSQLSNEERLKHADVVITNEGNLGEVKARVKELWGKIHAPDRKKVK
jgi:dephospho-CoA kinase